MKISSHQHNPLSWKSEGKVALIATILTSTLFAVATIALLLYHYQYLHLSLKAVHIVESSALTGAILSPICFIALSLLKGPCDTRKIQYYNLHEEKVETETVKGGFWIKTMYPDGKENLILKTCRKFLFGNRVTSCLMGWFYNTRLSTRFIDPFVEALAIKKDEFKVPTGGYSSFNDFFTRELFKEPTTTAEAIVAPATARYRFFENITPNNLFEVKGISYTLEQFLGDQALAQEYEKGTMIIARLAPQDYHRFHYPVSGRITQKAKRIKGALHSVNPWAIAKDPSRLIENQRDVTIITQDNQSKVAIVAVGAFGVGSIKHFERKAAVAGEQQGYFEFGGSTVVLLFKKGELTLNPVIQAAIQKVKEDQLEDTDTTFYQEIYMHVGTALSAPKS